MNERHVLNSIELEILDARVREIYIWTLWIEEDPDEGDLNKLKFD